MAIGYTAIGGVAWWLIPAILYIKTKLSDPQLQIDGVNLPPIMWFWSNLDNETDGWLAAFYLANFIVYLIGVVEAICWLLFTLGILPGLILLIEPTAAYWGSLVLYPVPVLFVILHMTLPTTSGGLAFDTYRASYTNDLILMILGLVFWVGEALMHIFYTQRFMKHARAKVALLELGCICDDVDAEIC